jgi:hypothetical protein
LDCDIPFDRKRCFLSSPSLFLLVPIFLFVAQETMRKELADFVGRP